MRSQVLRHRAFCALLLCAGWAPAAWADHRDAFIRLSKSDGKFLLDIRETLPAPFPELRPVLSDFSAYPDWVVRDVNAPPARPAKKYLLSVTSLRFDPAGAFFTAAVRLNAFFGGTYLMDVSVLDELSAAPPKLTATLRKPTPLVQGMSGVFRFPDGPGPAQTGVIFHGEARPHKVLYHLLPLGIVRQHIEERAGILIDNLHARALAAHRVAPPPPAAPAKKRARGR